MCHNDDGAEGRSLDEPGGIFRQRSIRYCTRIAMMSGAAVYDDARTSE